MKRIQIAGLLGASLVGYFAAIAVAGSVRAEQCLFNSKASKVCTVRCHVGWYLQSGKVCVKYKPTAPPSSEGSSGSAGCHGGPGKYLYQTHSIPGGSKSGKSDRPQKC